MKYHALDVPSICWPVTSLGCPPSATPLRDPAGSAKLVNKAEPSLRSRSESPQLPRMQKRDRYGDAPVKGTARPACPRTRLGLAAAVIGGLLLPACTATPDTASAPLRASPDTQPEPVAIGEVPSGPTTARNLHPAPAAPITTGSIRPAPASPEPFPARTMASPASPVPGSGSALGSGPAPDVAVEQRCAQLRREGEVWERARKLAVASRGEAGARTADAHTPWTMENVGFYLASCTRQVAKPRPPASSAASVTASPRPVSTSRFPASPSRQ